MRYRSFIHSQQPYGAESGLINVSSIPSHVSGDMPAKKRTIQGRSAPGWGSPLDWAKEYSCPNRASGMQ